MLIVYTGVAESVQNKHGIFRKDVAVEVSQEVGRGILQYPSFQEEIPQEKAKKNGKKGGE